MKAMNVRPDIDVFVEPRMRPREVSTMGPTDSSAPQVTKANTPTTTTKRSFIVDFILWSEMYREAFISIYDR